MRHANIRNADEVEVRGICAGKNRPSVVGVRDAPLILGASAVRGSYEGEDPFGVHFININATTTGGKGGTCMRI